MLFNESEICVLRANLTTKLLCPISVFVYKIDIRADEIHKIEIVIKHSEIKS